MKDWSTWCRLCGKIELTSDSVLNLTMDLIAIHKKLFAIDLLTDEFPVVVCADCLTFSINLDKFSRQCVKVDEMFTHLVAVWGHSTNNASLLDEVRYKYGLFDTFENHDVENQSKVPHNLETEEIRPIRSKRTRYAIHLSRRNSKENIRIKSQICKKEADKERNSIEFDDKIKLSNIERDTNWKIEEQGTVEKTFDCPVCSMKFKRSQFRGAHIRREHGHIKKPYKCKVCGKEFADSGKLKSHFIAHLPDNEKPVHKCPHCDKIFTRSVTKYIHIQHVHIDKREFVCDECGMSFHTNYRLKDHCLQHSDKRTLKCSFCPKQFRNRITLRAHEDTHSGTSYTCHLCNKVLNTKRNLKVHMDVHKEEKNFRCHICGNGYKRQKTLRRHVLAHSGIKI